MGLGLIGEQTGGTGPNAGPAMWQYFLPDALGSIRQVTDPTGQVLLTRRYDPFGGLQTETGLARSAYGFAGEEQDKNGQLFLRARTYDPGTGRFLQSDPVMGSPADPRTLHHYAYAFNNPVNYTDPSGLMPFFGSGNSGSERGTYIGPGSYAPTAPTQGGSGYYHLMGSGPPARSANGSGGMVWATRSDPHARQQSQGFRQGPCGIGSLLLGIRNGGQALIDTAQQIGSELEQDWRKHWSSCQNWVECRLYVPHSPTLNRVARATATFALENPDVVIGLIPVVGDLYDALSGLAGQDLLTGRELSKAEIALALGAGLLGLFTGGDELVGAFALLARTADRLSTAKLAGRGLNLLNKGRDALKAGGRALGQIAEAGLRRADEVAEGVVDVSRGVSRADEVAEAVVAAERGASHLDESGSVARSLDNFDGDCGNSFTTGTPIQTEEGQKPIEDIEIGDKVLAQDPETGEQGYFEVVALTNHPTDEILQVTVEAEDEESGNNGDATTLDSSNNNNSDGETNDSDHNHQTEMMEITPDHPVYVEGKGWVWAENLVVGDRLRRADGGWAKVLAVERVKLDEPESVYNFTVKGPHTYFVLEVGVLVHNTSCVWYPGAGKGTGRWRDKDGFISFDEARNRVELPGEAVDIHKISADSHIPERFFEPVQEIAREHKVICGLRDCNENLGNFLRIEINEEGKPVLTGDFWPKDTNVPIFNGVDSNYEAWLKASSAYDPRFKTNPYGLVEVTLGKTNYGIVRKSSGIFELEPMDDILMRMTINEEGKIMFDLSKGIPMGPDIDTYFFLKRTDTGFVNLGYDTPEELLLRWQIGRQMSYEIPGVGSMSLIGHGTAQPFFRYIWSPYPERYGFPKKYSWGHAFIVMDDGQFRIVPDQQAEAFFRYLDTNLTTYRAGPGPIPGLGVSKLKDPWLPPGYPPLPEMWLAH